MRIFYTNISNIDYNNTNDSLAILIKYFLKEKKINCPSSGWFSNNIYTINIFFVLQHLISAV